VSLSFSHLFFFLEIRESGGRVGYDTKATATETLTHVHKSRSADPLRALGEYLIQAANARDAMASTNGDIKGKGGDTSMGGQETNGAVSEAFGTTKTED
jgi:hypothetical protein